MMGLLKRHCTDKMHKYSLDIMSRMMIKQLSGESRSWPTEPGANSPPPAVVHNGNGLVKMLFAGAKAVHVAFALYRIGAMHIKAMLGKLKDWMG